MVPLLLLGAGFECFLWTKDYARLFFNDRNKSDNFPFKRGNGMS